MIGIDIVDIARFSDLPYKNNKEFYKKIFTKEEIKYCLSKKNPYKHFAGRFAAKEAFKKAFNKSNPLDIHIHNHKGGKPYARYMDSVMNYSVSISYEANFAIAVVSLA